MVPVSVGFAPLVRRKRVHSVRMVSKRAASRLELVPVVVVFAGLVIANFALGGWSPLSYLDNVRGMALISIGCFLALCIAFLVVGMRKRLEVASTDFAEVIFLPVWTGAMVLTGIVAGICAVMI